jgi:2-methylisocitrate lyase-like PEP mutase family enzyme
MPGDDKRHTIRYRRPVTKDQRDEMSALKQGLRARVTTGPIIVAPGVANALTARIVEELGFEAVYVSGAGVANTFLGVPDIGLVTLGELEAHVGAIRDVVSLPVIVDMDTGFGNAIGVGRTVRVLERAGADALQIEDQTAPKRCGHFNDKSVISKAEMTQKIRAAVDVRVDDDLLIVARTDARQKYGVQEALDRAGAYYEAGADLVFIEAPENVTELLSMPRLLPVPQVANMVMGGVTPVVPVSELGEFRMVLFANIALQGGVFGTQRALGTLLETGSLDAVKDVVGWDERQRLVRKHEFDDLERRYAVAEPEN